jgi:hypothetical protein
MSITKTLLAGVAGTVLVGSGAMAGEPLKLNETQMDNVTAGFVFSSAFASDVLAFTTVGSASRTANVFTRADESLQVRPTPPIFSIVESGEARADLTAACTGGCGLTSFGTFATVNNIGFPAQAAVN